MAANMILRDLVDDDLPIYFRFQQDPVANYMAAFVHEDPSDREAFEAHWVKIRANPTVIHKTAVVDGVVVGSVAKYEMMGEPEITYWIGTEFWGKGYATQALSMFLDIVKDRPINGRAAADNTGSIRVLEKCGFVKCGTDSGYANARGKEIEEAVFVLN